MSLPEHSWLQRALLAKCPVLVVEEYQDLGRALQGMVMGLCFTTGISSLWATSINLYTGLPALIRRILDPDRSEH